ncbi:MAG TPA: NCS2 family permease [Candidatus Limnocylindrales bacterium]|nr:NCS2 family permease [Candidatus Limnocylindrales bacterium]
MSTAVDSAPQSAGGGGAIADYFKFAERGTNMATEIKAGVTTFMVMAYIIFVNPSILAAAGIDPGAAAAATALTAGVLTILMGVVGNVPIALAAGLGINGIVAFFLAQPVENGGLGLGAAGAMGVIVLEGIAVLILVLVGLREAIMNAVPLSLKRAIGVGIGLFILFIGFVDGGLIRQPAGDGPVPVEFVFPNTPAAWMTLLGLLITVVLFVRKVPAALLLSIFITSILAFVFGITSIPAEGIVATPNFSTVGMFDLTKVFDLGILTAILVIFTIMLADFFDTMGTATAIGEQAGLTTKDGQLPGIGRVLLVDSIGAAVGGAAGISSNTSYIESAAGVAEGGRTGFASVVTGVLFLVAILVTPLAPLVPFAATAPVLIVVGFLMASLIMDIDFRDVEEGLPALFGLILMPLTFSITVGIGAAFVSYVLIKVARGKAGSIHPLMWATATAFVIYFAQRPAQQLIDAIT